MIYRRLHPWVLLLLLIGLGACDTTPDTYQTDLQEDYYPLEIGRSWTYQVDSVIYSPTGDSSYFNTSNQLQEVVVDSFVDGAGITQFRIEQFTRPNDTTPWQSTQVLSAWIDAERGFRTENNLTFIKLLFPPEPFQRWDGNAYIDETTQVRVGGELVELFKGWDYETLSAGEAEQIGMQSYGEVLTIQPAQSENLIELREVQEKYARGVGLVYRKMRILDTQNIDGTLEWEERAEQGFILTQTLIDYQ